MAIYRAHATLRTSVVIEVEADSEDDAEEKAEAIAWAGGEMSILKVNDAEVHYVYEADLEGSGDE